MFFSKTAVWKDGSKLVAMLSWLKGAQWLSGRVLDSDQEAAGSSLTGITALCPRARTLILA